MTHFELLFVVIYFMFCFGVAFQISNDSKMHKGARVVLFFMALVFTPVLVGSVLYQYLDRHNG